MAERNSKKESVMAEEAKVLKLSAVMLMSEKTYRTIEEEFAQEEKLLK
jgi:hypothetical protein